MKTQELKEIIRSVVKEELQKSLPTLIPNILSEILTGQSKPTVSENLEKPKVSQKPIENVPPTKKTFKKYTNNDALNAVLNETVGGVPLEADTGPSAMDTIANLPKQVLAENKEVAAVATALTRDYSQMMKAIDAKAKAKRI